MRTDPYQHFSRALIAMSRLISFFPSDVETQEIIISQMKRFVGTTGDVAERLEWFTQEAINRFQTWGPDGCNIPNLRALYCTRYDPADGIQPSVVLEGYAEGDLEARYRTRELEEYDDRRAEWEEQKRLNPAAYAPLQLEAPLTKPFPKPEKAIPPRQKPVRNGTLDDEEDRLKKELESAVTPGEDERKRKTAELERQVRERLERRGA